MNLLKALLQLTLIVLLNLIKYDFINLFFIANSLPSRVIETVNIVANKNLRYVLKIYMIHTSSECRI